MYQISNEKFGLFVTELRKKKNLTQKDLAEKLYVSDKTVSKWERGYSEYVRGRRYQHTYVVSLSLVAIFFCWQAGKHGLFLNIFLFGNHHVPIC